MTANSTNPLAPAEIAFSPSVAAGYSFAPPQCVTGALAFALVIDPVNGSLFEVDLTSDGTHTPTFPGMTEADFSDGWDNTAGVVNSITLSSAVPGNGPIGTGLGYSILVPSDTPIPCISSISVAPGTNPTLTITVGGAELDLSYVPAPSAFAISRVLTFGNATSLAVVGVTLSATAIELALSGIVSAGDTVTLAYTSWPTGKPPYPPFAQDSSGNLLASFTNATVTVT
jgi:hypothetical protein